MMNKLIDTEYLTRDAVMSYYESLFNQSSSVKVVKCLQDYSGNYDEIYNEYVNLNLKTVGQMLADYFLDNVILEGKKDVEFIYCIKQPVSTYLKFESQRVNVLNHMNFSVYATEINCNSDFVIFDNSFVLVLDYTPEGALKGGYISNKNTDAEEFVRQYSVLKEKVVNFLQVIPCETSLKKIVDDKIKVLKQNLNLD